MPSYTFKAVGYYLRIVTVDDGLKFVLHLDNAA